MRHNDYSVKAPVLVSQDKHLACYEIDRVGTESQRRKVARRYKWLARPTLADQALSLREPMWEKDFLMGQEQGHPTKCASFSNLASYLSVLWLHREASFA